MGLAFRAGEVLPYTFVPPVSDLSGTIGNDALPAIKRAAFDFWNRQLRKIPESQVSLGNTLNSAIRLIDPGRNKTRSGSVIPVTWSCL